MNYSLVIVLLAFFLFISGCNKRQIIGKWKREYKANLEQGFDAKNSNWGGITFNSDCTFFIAGDEDEYTSNDSVPGWHAGGDMKGKWRIEKKELLLKLEELPPNFFLRYKIIQLTNERLVLLSSFDKDDTTNYITYSRNE